MHIQFKYNAPHLKAKLHKLRRNEDGATAIEFAILGLPFLALLFGIIELAVIFFISATTQHSLEAAARTIRTGEFQATAGTSADFKTEICSAMVGIGDCDNLRVDVVSSGTGRFSTLTLPVSPAPQVPCTGTAAEIAACLALPAQPNMPADTYTTTIGEDVVIVRVQYVHHLALPSTITKLSNTDGNYHIITHTTAFRNEPF